MFDIGFTEILVIATISLLVIGPERLPETVRTVSLWIGRFKRSLRETRREIEQHIGADDIRRELHNEEVMKSLEKIRTEVSSGLEDEIDPDKEVYPPGHSRDRDTNSAIDNSGGLAEPPEGGKNLESSPAVKQSPQHSSSSDPVSSNPSSSNPSSTNSSSEQSDTDHKRDAGRAPKSR